MIERKEKGKHFNEAETKMVGGGGIEPPTSSSSTTRSPTELTAHFRLQKL